MMERVAKMMMGIKTKVLAFKNRVLALLKNNKPSENSSENRMPPIRKYIARGFMVLGVFFGVFFIWSIVAPLEKAAIAPGKVTVSSYHKEIQHLEGGIIKALYVQDGSKVREGDLLLKLKSQKPGTAIRCDLALRFGSRLL